MKKLFFTSGEFASLCGVTKETLRHYNNIGILKPTKISEKGYRYYSHNQVFDFQLISTLKSTGCSLETIYNYLYEENEDNFQKILVNQLNKLLIEKENLIKKEEIIKRSIKKFDEIKKMPLLNTYYVEEEEEEEYFIITRLYSFTSDVEWIRAVQEHLELCKKKNLNIEYQFYYIFTIDKNTGEEMYYLGSKIDSKIQSDSFHIKPKGRYIKYIHKGGYIPDEIYKEAEEYAVKNGLIIEQSMYESEISPYIVQYKENYMSEISIKIT